MNMTTENNSAVIEELEPETAALAEIPDAPEQEPAPEPEKLTREETIAKAFDKVEGDKPAEDEVKAEKPAKEVKETKDVAEPELKEAPAKPVKAAAEKPADEQGKAVKPASEAAQYVAPPARFLPEAVTKWENTPNNVKAEVHRVIAEVENELTEHRQFREELREYEELAKQHNVSVKDTMQRYVAADRQLNENFGAGVASLFQMYGKNPVQGINEILQAQGVTPHQYAEYILKQPQQAQQQPMQQQPQSNAEIEAIRRELDAFKQEQANAQRQAQIASVTPVIHNFAQQHPDYALLEGKIANILKSGIIEQNYGNGLTLEAKLAEAYRMAGGRPSIQAQQESESYSEPNAPRPVDLDGQKSIKGSTNGINKAGSGRRVSREEAINAALASAGV